MHHAWMVSLMDILGTHIRTSSRHRCTASCYLGDVAQHRASLGGCLLHLRSLALDSSVQRIAQQQSSSSGCSHRCSQTSQTPDSQMPDASCRQQKIGTLCKQSASMTWQNARMADRPQQGMCRSFNASPEGSAQGLSEIGATLRRLLRVLLQTSTHLDETGGCQLARDSARPHQ